MPLSDCFVLTQTLHVIGDDRRRSRHAHRISKPGGVLLATMPVLSPLRGNPDHPVDFWRLTPGACACLFGDVFGSEQVDVEAHGNLTAAIAFLCGAAYQELSRRQLERRDARHPLICTIRAVPQQMSRIAPTQLEPNVASSSSSRGRPEMLLETVELRSLTATACQRRSSSSIRAIGRTRRFRRLLRPTGVTSSTCTARSAA